MTRSRLALRFVRGLFTAAWQSVVTWVVVVAAITAVVALVASQFSTIDALRTRNFQLGSASTEGSKRYDRLFDEYSKLYDESEQQGVRPSTTDPSDVPSKATSGSTPGATGATGATGIPGAPGKDGRDGKDGEDGADGLNGSDGRSGATGDMGIPGQTGAAGPTGATGPQGPTGATGPAGKDGTDGKDGRGVASVTCVATDAGTAYRFTFTDSTTADVAGACVPPVTPTDPVTPAE
ncbi:hypothetical protein ACIPJ2_15995 [Curtobacterium sp. NPDC090217]|uniref:hypothetical protein n=1 Tax=Curtobacterium sp. NPDC090217 TaxID=3363970 RepID=UPI00381CA249